MEKNLGQDLMKLYAESGKEEHFVMIYSISGIRYVGVMLASEILQWNLHSKKVALLDPKIYAEMQAPENPRQIMPVIVPINQVPTRQKLMWLQPDFIGALEDLGVVSEDGTDCADSREFFNMYRDAVTRWQARLANVIAPTSSDIGIISGIGKRPNGSITLK